LAAGKFPSIRQICEASSSPVAAAAGQVEIILVGVVPEVVPAV
jgi:hypothetical protein